MIKDINQFFGWYDQEDEIREQIKDFADKENYPFELEITEQEMLFLDSSDFGKVLYGLGEIVPFHLHSGDFLLLIKSNDSFKNCYQFIESFRLRTGGK